MIYRERQDAFVKAFRLLEGSKVKVVRTFPDWAEGWENIFNSTMKKAAKQGKELTIRNIEDGSGGILLSDGWRYPFQSLLPNQKPFRASVVRVELNSNHVALVSEDKIVVGCQTFDPSIVEKLQEALKSLDKPAVSKTVSKSEKNKKTTKRKK